MSKKQSSHADKDELRPEYDLRSLLLVGVGSGRKTPKQTPPKYSPASTTVRRKK